MADRLSELSTSNALLGAALAELRSYRISYAIADALIGVGVTDAELSEFFDLAANAAPADKTLKERADMLRDEVASARELG